MERESRTLEYKSSYFGRDGSKATFLKTVSAYANYGTGRIVFGVDDSSCVQGVPDVDRERLAIDHSIKGKIEPVPDYRLSVEEWEGREVIVLTVFEGDEKPYTYDGRAYGRTDSSSDPVDGRELRRLAGTKADLSFCERASPEQNLQFSILNRYLVEALGREASADVLNHALGLKDTGGLYTNTARVLADVNSFPGTLVVAYAHDETSIRKRSDLAGVSLLEQMEACVALFRDNYVEERVEGSVRRPVELVPERAFREALANALAHRAWDIDSPVVISLYPGRLRVTSPGGLPEGLCREAYLAGDMPLHRNRSLAYILYRLGLIEGVGSGVARIRRAYADVGAATDPTFGVTDTSLSVWLPVVEQQASAPCVPDVLQSMIPGVATTRAEVGGRTGLATSTVAKRLKELCEAGLVERLGSGRSTRYVRKE